MASPSTRRCSPSGFRSTHVRAARWALSLLIAGLVSGPSLAQEEAPAPPEIAPAEPTEQAPGPSATAQFTNAVENREPIDQVTFVAHEARKIFFFSELRGLEGRTVTHRWSYSGETVSLVPFDVGGPRWRVWSTKDLNPDWIGDWTVEIVLDDGEVIAAETFTYSAPEG